jgi:hypothetical protein
VAQVPVHLLGVPADGPWAAAQDRQLHQPLADQRLKAGAQRTLPRLSVLGQDSQRLLDVDRGSESPPWPRAGVGGRQGPLGASAIL